MILKYISRRALQALFVLWLAATLAFVAMKLAPGDPAQTLLAASGASTSEIIERRAQLGLNDPPLTQYMTYINDLLQGRLGHSWLHGRPVSAMILEQLPATATLALAATAIGAALGLVLGIIAARYRYTWAGHLATALSVASISTPTYWSGLLAILCFSVYLDWLPSTGTGSPRTLILPATVLGIALSGSIARVVRARLVDVMQAPFVLAAKARGLPIWRVFLIHTLRPALPPALTVVALQLGFLLSGAVVTESIFARPGLGQLAVEAILWRDLPVVRGTIICGALLHVLASLLADLAHAWLDPRLREQLL